MPEADAGILIGTAAGLAALHATIGVDHSIPFIVLKHARAWSLRKTLLITGICGLGHVASSVAIGTVGVALGIGLKHLAWLEAARGKLAGWLLIAFGLAYAARAMTRAMRGSLHAHVHVHRDGTVHAHTHDHHAEHLHPHDAAGRRATPWLLFVVFVLGPCETLIPLMMAPAANGDPATLCSVIAVFGTVTLATMLTLVTAGCLGVEHAPGWSRASLRHADVLTGLTIAASGAAVMILGV